MANSVPEGEFKDGVRCYMTKEGALVCERLPAGNYRLEAAAPKAHDETGALKDAPRCDPTRPEDCLTYCYVMDDGSMVWSILNATVIPAFATCKLTGGAEEAVQLPCSTPACTDLHLGDGKALILLDHCPQVCEGLPAGEYQIKTAGPEDVERMVQHALALEKGATYKDLAPAAAAAQETKKDDSLLGKIMGLFRSS